MNINSKIKNRRKELGINKFDIAKQAGLTVHEYFDIELHDDEITTVTELLQVKKIVENLNLNFFELFNLRCAFCDDNKNYVEEYLLPLNELIHKKRIEMGYSVNDLGDRIGFEDVAIKDMEINPHYLERWPIVYIKDISDAIDVPLQVLLNVKCNKCGQ